MWFSHTKPWTGSVPILYLHNGGTRAPEPRGLAARHPRGAEDSTHRAPWAAGPRARRRGGVEAAGAQAAGYGGSPAPRGDRHPPRGSILARRKPDLSSWNAACRRRHCRRFGPDPTFCTWAPGPASRSSNAAPFPFCAQRRVRPIRRVRSNVQDQGSKRTLRRVQQKPKPLSVSLSHSLRLQRIQ